MPDPTVVSPVPTNAQDETRSVVKAAGLIGVATFSSRILGFIRDMVLATLFGATPVADAFFVAYRDRYHDRGYSRRVGDRLAPGAGVS